MTEQEFRIVELRQRIVALVRDAFEGGWVRDTIYYGDIKAASDNYAVDKLSEIDRIVDNLIEIAQSKKVGA